MPKDTINRTLARSSSQYSTGEAIGHAEDYSDILYNIDPVSYPLTSAFGDTKEGTEVDFFWYTTGLSPAKKNAHAEDMNYTFEKGSYVEGMRNYQQHLYDGKKITDAQKKSKMQFTKSDWARLREESSIQLAKDIEYAICKNSISQAEVSASDPAITGGIPYFMKANEVSVAVNTTGSVFTTTNKHMMKTGEFVFINATTLPTGLSADLEYYVRVTSDTTFTLFNTIEGAVENIDSDAVTVTTAGAAVKILKNNVINLGGTADYTLEDINTVADMAKKRGGKPTHIYMSSRKKRRFSQLVTAIGTTYRKSTEKKMVEVATAYQSDAGTFTAYPHDMYSDNRIDILDMEYWDHKWFDRVHEVKGLDKDGSFDKFALEGWYGLQASQPKASASVIGIKR